METREKIQVTTGLRCIVIVIVIEKKKRTKKIFTAFTATQAKVFWIFEEILYVFV